MARALLVELRSFANLSSGAHCRPKIEPVSITADTGRSLLAEVARAAELTLGA